MKFQVIIIVSNYETGQNIVKIKKEIKPLNNDYYRKLRFANNSFMKPNKLQNNNYFIVIAFMAKTLNASLYNMFVKYSINLTIVHDIIILT